MRAIDIRVDGGMELRLLPDRGLHIGCAWALGRSLSWVSGVGERPPIPTPTGFEWGEGFGGGLMVTCGLRNVGMPSEGHSLHGNYSHQKALIESVRRRLTADEAYVEVRGSMDDASATGHHLRLERTVRTHAGRHRVEIEDLTTNLGRSAELPRLHQWIHPAPGVYVLGIEPANCSTSGRAHDRAQGRLPMLEPGEARETYAPSSGRRLSASRSSSAGSMGPHSLARCHHPSGSHRLREGEG